MTVKRILILLLIVTSSCALAESDRQYHRLFKKRPRIGLVLGGGGARGVAHVAVLRMLEEKRIPVDLIVGTSMGAIVGGLYASGMSVDDIEKKLFSINWNDLFTDAPPRQHILFRRKQDDKKYLPDFEMGFRNWKCILPKGLIAGQKLDFMLKSLTLEDFQISDFNKLSIAYRAVATDIENGEKVVIAHGNLAEAMRASMSVPGVFCPFELNGRMLVDGGIVDNLPIDVAKEMGADVIIAVDVGMPLRMRDKLNSMVEITSQVIGIMTEQNVKRSIKLLRDRDLLVLPEIGDIQSTDFDKVSEIVKRAEVSVKEMADDFNRYSVSKEEYLSYVKQKQQSRKKTSVTVDFIKIRTPKRVFPQLVKSKLKTKVGTKLDLEKLRWDLERIYEIGYFELVDFSLKQKEKETGLVIDAVQKSWGPNYVRIGVNLQSDLDGVSYYDLLMEYTMTELNRFGAELKTEFQVGRTARTFAEFYQPLGYSGLFFVAPWGEIVRDVFDVYRSHHRIAEYRLRYMRGAFDLGMQIGTLAELRFGLQRGRAHAGPLIGSLRLRHFYVNVAGYRGRIVIDQMDNANFPRHGYFISSNLFLSRKRLGSYLNYGKLDGGFIKALTFKKNTLLLSFYTGGNVGKETLPYYDTYTLGGFLSLSGYHRDELRGRYYGLAEIVYYYQIAKLPSAIGKGVYIGGSFEYGNTWWLRKNYFNLKKMRWGASAILGADTILGPIYLAYGRCNNGQDTFYFYLGRTF